MSSSSLSFDSDSNLSENCEDYESIVESDTSSNKSSNDNDDYNNDYDDNDDYDYDDDYYNDHFGTFKSIQKLCQNPFMWRSKSYLNIIIKEIKQYHKKKFYQELKSECLYDYMVAVKNGYNNYEAMQYAIKHHENNLPHKLIEKII
jgi:hypothetical protein